MSTAAIKFGLFLLLITVFGCGPDKRDEEISKHFRTVAACDSVSWLGAGFEFPKSIRIDSVNCLRNNKKLISSDLWKGEESNRIIIYDTFLYKNEYQLILYSEGKRTSYPVGKILWKSHHVYHGAVCGLTSCEFNDTLIMADAGTFEIPVELLK